MKSRRKSSKGIMALSDLKGVYTMNPTDSVMKTGSRKARAATTEDVPGFKKIKRPKMGKGKTK